MTKKIFTHMDGYQIVKDNTYANCVGLYCGSSSVHVAVLYTFSGRSVIHMVKCSIFNSYHLRIYYLQTDEATSTQWSGTTCLAVLQLNRSFQ